MGYLIICAAVLGALHVTVVLLWLGGLLNSYYLLKYKCVPPIYLAANDRFKEIANRTAAPVLTVANGHKLWPSSRVLFFPDPKVPCSSYIRSFELNAGHVKCLKKDCDMFHYNDIKKSSLMTIIESLRGARQVDLCMYMFSLEETCDVLVSLHRSGTRVRIITDNFDTDLHSDQVPRLKSSGIEVREMTYDSNLSRRERPLMHNKFVIIDQRVCFSGSFNWTWKALTRNYETVIECHERAVVLPLIKKFDELWDACAASASQTRLQVAAASSSQTHQNLNNNNNQRGLNQQSWRAASSVFLPPTRQLASHQTHQNIGNNQRESHEQSWRSPLPPTRQPTAEANTSSQAPRAHNNNNNPNHKKNHNNENATTVDIL